MILAGCATSPVMHGETRAVGAVKADAVRQITQLAKIVARCDAVDAIQSKVVKINPVGSGGTEASQKYGSVEEHWVVYLCGQKSPYLVILTPDGQGDIY